MKTKVFGIGFHKTGTTSLRRALEILGYRVTGPNHVYDRDIAQTYVDKARRLSNEFDGFQDNPWPLLYREMDAMWPNAKFVLTYRESDKWVSSATKHFGEGETPMRALIYGEQAAHPAGHESHYRATYEQHNRDVRAYFAGRQDKLLELNFEQGAGWAELCPFLQLDIPEIPFPHANSAADRGAAASKVGKWQRRLRRFGLG